jgi:DNA repair exonuclease SbcCD ATPase subunit
MNFSDALKNNIDDLNEGLNEELNEDLYDETESSISFGENGSIEADLIAVQELLINLTEQTEEQHQQIASLANAFNDIAAILQQMQSSNPTAAIDVMNQNIDVLSRAVINVYKHQEKNNPATELNALKTSQQALQKIVETNHQNLINKNPASHLHWKQTTAIIVITALLSSLCSFAIGQITQPSKPEPTIPAIKKSPKPKKTG